MDEEYFSIELTRQQAERITFSLPLGYCLLSTQMIEKPFQNDKPLHLEIALNQEIRNRQKNSKIHMKEDQNVIANDILFLLDFEGWRFKIIQNILTINNQSKLKQYLEFVSFEEIKIKILQKRYRNIHSFIADIHSIIYSATLKQRNIDYKQQSNFICKIVERLKRVYKLCQDQSNQFLDSQQKSIMFTKELQNQLENILPQLKAKYFRNLHAVVGQDYIYRRKDNSQYLDIAGLPPNIKYKLLQYVRKCRKEQIQDQMKLKLQYSEPQSSFLSDGSLM